MTATKAAKPKQLRAIARVMSDQYLECRVITGHNWKLFKVTDDLRSYSHYCPNCKTNRFQKINARGLLVKNRYQYQKDFHIKGLGQLRAEDRGILRIESVTRMKARLDAA